MSAQASQQIADWLEKLGMSEYAQRFAENGIDLSVFPDLTDQDLKDIGVLLGHRRKLLRAIAELNNAATTAVPAPPPVMPASITAAVAPPPISTSVETTGERRHVTVMFCDLVDSTGIAAKLDAEEWRDLVGAYLNAASNAVTEMGGKVAKKLGDGLMALFGYPMAQENDAERAVRAALAMQRALSELNRKNQGTSKPALAARIAIDSGPVVVDATGEIFGEVPNIAARAQALAEPGSLVITARVQRQIAGLFVAEERGSHELKGVPQPVTLYRIVRASGGGRRAGQRHLTPLVGRDEEMPMLMRRWERARQGDGQLVLIVGEPGLGKSRLIEEFHARLREVPHTWVEWSCSQLLQNTPLHPVTEWGRMRFGGADVPAEQRLAELESSLGQVKLDQGENIPLLAPLLDIPLPQERVSTLPPEELRRRQLAAVTAWAIAGASVQPVVLVLEDAHWADPTTLDVARGIAERGALARLFVLISARPEFRAPWSTRSHHSVISLSPLDGHQVRRMVGELAARHALPKEVVDGVTERTGGVPLFVEEVTRLLLEGGTQGGIQAIPPTLQQSLTARLDRLGPAREVAQIGAVIGRDFSYALVRGVAGMEDAPLQAALERLAEADILLVQGLPPESHYRFKHALIQDAAYENLLKSRRQVLHRRIAEVLRDKFADITASAPEVLGHHFTQAGLNELAIEWWGKAGDQALHRSAYVEATGHLGKAIEMTEKLAAATSAAPQGSQRLRLQIAYGNALISARGYQAQETTAAFARARELAANIEDAAERYSAYYGAWASSYVRGELAPMRELAEEFLHDADCRPGLPEAGVAHRVFGGTCWFQGDFVAARRHLEQALAGYEPERDRSLAFQFGQDVVVSAMINLAHVLWPLGELERARRLVEEALTLAMRSGHVPTMAYGQYYKCLFEAVARNAARAMPHADALVGLSREHGLPFFLTSGIFYHGWTRWHADDREAGTAEMRQGIALAREHGIGLAMPLYGLLLAEAEAEAGQIDAGLIRLDELILEIERTGQRWIEAQLNRARGKLLIRHKPAETAAAEDAFMRSIAVARHQQTKTFELQAATSLARFWRGQGKRDEARELLAPVHGWFTEGFDTLDLKEAKALLDELAP